MRSSLFQVFLRVGCVLGCIILNACTVPSPNLYIPEKEPFPYRLKAIRPKVVLVLGSGSSRGFAHAGVLKVLEENRIPVDMIVGTSAGSIIGALYSDNPSAASLQKLLLTTSRDEVLDISLLNIGSGVISGKQLQNFLVKHMRASTFEKLRIPFAAVATDLNTGKIHVFKSGPIAPAVNASSAVPPFFRPVKLYGKTYIDGGLVDPVAVDVAQRFHPKIIIAVNISSPLSQELPKHSPSVLLRGIDMMVAQLNDYSASQADIVIKPEQDEIGMFDGDKREELIYSGEVATRKMIPGIKQLLIKNHIGLKKR